MKQLKTLTLEQILNNYELPHRLLTYFSAQCAKDALSLIPNPDPRSLQAVDIAERYGNGEDISLEDRKKAWKEADAAYSAANYAAANSAAYSAASSAAYSAAAASSAASYAANYAAYSAANYAAASSSANYTTTRNNKEIEYRDLLINLIQKRLTEVEKVILFG